MSISGQLEWNTLKFTWSLTNFSKLGKKVGDKIISPIFKIRDLQWRLILYPYGDVESAKDFTSVFLENLSQTELKVYYALVLTDVTGTTLVDGHSMNSFGSAPNHNWGWPKIIKRESLITKMHSAKDEALNISCEIQMDVDNAKEVNIQAKILHDYETLFFNENFSDLTIIINNNRMKVHKNILSARSEVFKAMFRHDMKENNTNTLKITDVSYNIMKEVLLFIYSGKVNNMKENARKLLLPADKYGITELKILCEKSIWKNVKIEDACETLIFTELYKCSELKAKIIGFIVTNIKEIKKTSGLKNLNRSNPELFEEIFDKLVEQK